MKSLENFLSSSLNEMLNLSSDVDLRHLCMRSCVHLHMYAFQVKYENSLFKIVKLKKLHIK